MSALPAHGEVRRVDGSLASRVSACDWECTTADTRYLTHDIHRYSSKYIPQIAAQAIELLTAPGEVVLDPMVGSGTTLVEAWIKGRRALGIDLNPLAVRITRAKISPVDDDALASAVMLLTDVAENLERPSLTSPPLLENSRQAVLGDWRRTDAFFTKWFQPHVLDDLLVIDHAIRSVSDARIRNLAEVALSDILRRSSNAHSGYPNVMFDRKAPVKAAPGAIFAKTLRTYADLVRTLRTLDYEQPRVDLGDARATGLPDESVDAIVTHPPYVGSVPYAEYGLLSLRWAGADTRALDAKLIGGKRQTRDVVERFRAGYRDALKEAHRVLRRGRHMFLMVGDPVVRGSVVDLAAMTRELATAAGFIEVACGTRRGVNRRANKMAHETLLFFEKPA